MTTQTLERNPSAPRHDEPERMALRTDLYLIAHSDDTGQPHIDKHSIAAGLAAAVLLELWYADRVHLDWRGNPEHGTWKSNHSDIILIDASATGDPINDSALVLLWKLGGTADTQRFINEFATTDLYERVRDHLTSSRILRTFTRRRYWFFRTQIRRPRFASYPVRARARIRDVARLYRPHPRDLALAALVTALRLTPHVRLGNYSVSGVHAQLAELVGREHPLRHIARTIRPHHHTYR